MEKMMAVRREQLDGKRRVFNNKVASALKDLIITNAQKSYNKHQITI